MSDEHITVTRTEITAVEATIAVRPTGVVDHWCEHPGCKRWGSFGYTYRDRMLWYCGEHRHGPGSY